jgi:hypothetical protein
MADALSPTDIRQAPVPQTLQQINPYASPNELADRRAYANALLKQSLGDVPGTRGGWTVGLRNMVDALVGGHMGYQANQMDRGNQTLRANAGDPLNPVVPTVPQGQALPDPTKPWNFDPTSNNVRAASADATLGDAVSSSKGGAFDKVFAGTPLAGKEAAVAAAAQKYGVPFDVMAAIMAHETGHGANVKGNNVAGLMDPRTNMQTKQQFPDIESGIDAAGRVIARNYNQSGGDLKAMGRRYAPPGAANDPYGLNGGWTSGVQAYRQKFAGADPMQFSRTPAMPEGQEAIVNALAGDNTPQRAQAKPSESPYTPTGGWDPKPYLPPGSFQVRTPISRDQLRLQLSDPQTTVAERTALTDRFMQQYQPIQAPVTGGVVLINPQNPMQQKFIPTLEKGQTTRTVGPLTRTGPSAYTVNPFGGGAQQLYGPDAPVHNPAQAYPPSPTVAPPPPASPAANVLPGVGGSPLSPTPAIPPQPMVKPQSAVEAPVKTASLGNPMGVLSDAPPPGATAAINAPVPSIQNVTPALANQPPGGVQVAQAGPYNKLPLPPGGLIQPEEWEALGGLNKLDAQKKQMESSASELGTTFAKRYDTGQQDAARARELQPQVTALKNLLNTPGNGAYTGFGADKVLDFQRAKAAFGQWIGDKDMQGAASANELIKKLVSGSILSQLKPLTQGTGQIRNKEIELIERYNANPNNTLESNRALAEILDRTLKRTDMWADLQNQYAAGHAVIDPVTGKELLPEQDVPRGGLDFGWDRLAKKINDAHPAFSEEETKKFNKLASEEAPAEANPGKPQPTLDDIKYLKANPKQKPYFEKQFGPSDKWLK